MAVSTENVVGELPEEQPSFGSGLWEGVKGLFSFGAEYGEADVDSLEYERRLWDRQIEGYLDSALPEYLNDFGILDEIALHIRDERMADLTTRSHDLMQFARTFGDDLGVQEERLTLVEKAARKKSG